MTKASSDLRQSINTQRTIYQLAEMRPKHAATQQCAGWEAVWRSQKCTVRNFKENCWEPVGGKRIRNYGMYHWFSVRKHSQKKKVIPCYSHLKGWTPIIPLKQTYLSPWRKNPKVHHRTHNSPPPVIVLSLSNPINDPQASLPKTHSDPIFPPMPWS
jgi:hypothetical protein